MSAYGQIVTSDDVFWSRFAGENRVYPKNSSDSIGNDSAGSNWEITADGSATFAGGKCEIGAPGWINMQSSLTAGRENNTGGYLYTFKGNTTGYGDGGFSDVAYELLNDGSATFEKDVQSGGGFRATGNNSGNWTTGSGWEVLSTGINAYDRAASSFIAGSINTSNWQLNSDGSATFAGDISGAAKLKLGPEYGAIEVRGDSKSPGDAAFVIHRGGSNNAFATFSIEQQGNVNIGGTIPSAPNISIKADGSASFAGIVETEGTRGGFISGQVPLVAADTAWGVWSGKNYAGSTTSQIKGDGSAEFAGRVTAPQHWSRISDAEFAPIVVSNQDNFFNTIEGRVFQVDNDGAVYINGVAGADITTYANPNISLNANGSAEFAGVITANGSILTRASGDLDVGERLEKADNALQALKTAVATATDFTTLKAAIISSLQEV